MAHGAVLTVKKIDTIRDSYEPRNPIGAPTLLKYPPGGMEGAALCQVAAQIKAGRSPGEIYARQMGAGNNRGRLSGVAPGGWKRWRPNWPRADECHVTYANVDARYILASRI